MDEEQVAHEQTTESEPHEYRGLGHDMIVAGAGAAVGGVVGPVMAQLTGQLLGGQKPPKEVPKVILPPGSHRD